MSRSSGCSWGAPGWTSARPGAPSPGSAQSWSPACRAWWPRWLAVSSAGGRCTARWSGQGRNIGHKGRPGAEQRRKWSRTPPSTVFTSSALRPAQRPCRSWGVGVSEDSSQQDPNSGRQRAPSRGGASLGAQALAACFCQPRGAPWTRRPARRGRRRPHPHAAQSLQLLSTPPRPPPAFAPAPSTQG